MSHTLVLNADHRPLNYLPLSAVSWQDAVKLILLDRVIVLEEYTDWEVHSPSITLKVPSVIITKEYMNYKRTVRFSRKNLYLRDLYQCQYCFDRFPDHELTIDHVVPRAAGGKTSWENCVAACQQCNTRKGHKHMLPKRLPFKPEYWHLVGNKQGNMDAYIHHDSWRKYLD